MIFKDFTQFILIGGSERFENAFSSITDSSSLLSLKVVDLKNFVAYEYQKHFLKCLEKFEKLKYLEIDIKHFPIRQELFDSISHIKTLQTFSLRSEIAFDVKTINFEPLRMVNI